MNEERRRFSRKIGDPIIRGLFNRLPNPGEVWADDARQEWLATLEQNLKLVYPSAKQQPVASAPPHVSATPRAV